MFRDDFAWENFSYEVILLLRFNHYYFANQIVICQVSHIIHTLLYTIVMLGKLYMSNVLLPVHLQQFIVINTLQSYDSVHTISIEKPYQANILINHWAYYNMSLLFI